MDVHPPQRGLQNPRQVVAGLADCCRLSCVCEAKEVSTGTTGTDREGRERWKELPGLREASPGSTMSIRAAPTTCCKGPAKVFRLHLFSSQNPEIKEASEQVQF